MTTRRVSLLVGLLCSIASATPIAQTDLDINGRINGSEYCFQSLGDPCDWKAKFTGVFIGKVGEFRDVVGIWDIELKHGDLNYENRGQTPILQEGGEWKLILSNSVVISGTIDAGGTLTYRAGSNTFDVNVTLIDTHGGKVKVDAVLNHNSFPPPVTGRMSSE
jgi:hypothetical protein